jgi:hypothetical protein
VTSGALISKRLEARVYLTLGKASKATSDQAIQAGEDLIVEIKEEISQAYHNGVERARAVGNSGAVGVTIPSLNRDDDGVIGR